jgi:hypothetical protein
VPDDTELPDDMTVREFRELVNKGLARISIDDGTGGITIGSPIPELV